MRTLTILATALLGSLFATPLASAGVGKLEGTFTGHGNLLDKSSAPISYYNYEFKSLKVTVKSNGDIIGSSTVALTVATNPKGPFLPVKTEKVALVGKAKITSKTKDKISATTQLKFTNGASIDGSFSVSAKTGKGTFKSKDKTPTVEVDFEASKKAAKPQR